MFEGHRGERSERWTTSAVTSAVAHQVPTTRDLMGDLRKKAQIVRVLTMHH